MHRFLQSVCKNVNMSFKMGLRVISILTDELTSCITRLFNRAVVHYSLSSLYFRVYETTKKSFLPALIDNQLSDTIDNVGFEGVSEQ